jgi:NADPH-ferrihemoprotein reductase
LIKAAGHKIIKERRLRNEAFISQFICSEHLRQSKKRFTTSTRRVHKDRIHITAVVVEYTTKTGRNNKGVATTWLKPMEPGTKVPCFVRRSQFRLPNRPQTPVIMIGPGTGLAPFRGFIQGPTL